ncbi:CMGC/CDK/CDC2 protein kinase [Phytophthora megakarya]|uniref:Cyclin-F n=1 Tax=Phytophthora megakarya TaxID=4795 RepID=A0A225WBK1_9STRA|nr:CMGC/CDK/CDC2 protein kinase [Phytophthora megakarya]
MDKCASSSDATPSKKRRAASAHPPPLGGARNEPERKRSGLLVAAGAENPILAALGGTPRSAAAAANGFPEPEPLDLAQPWARRGPRTPSSRRSEVRRARQQQPSTAPWASVQEMEQKAPHPVGKRKREDEAPTTDFVAYAREHIHSQEAGDEGFSIDPSERAVEHRASKVVRREILIASPAANDEDEWDNAPPHVKMEDVDAVLTPCEHFDLQPIDIILHVFSFLVTAKELQNMAQVSKKWKELTSRRSLYRSLPSVTPEGSVNWINFKNLGIKNKGTEGTCIKCCQRSTGKILAMKKARVFPKGEGVPYYMLRELAVLKGIKHDHIASLELISLAKDELHVFFPYVDKTLHEIINPTGDPNGGRVLPEAVIRKFLHQLLDAIAYCHRRGVLHRNLKPKHLLIKTSDTDNLSDATLQISDFALVRATGIPRRTYTMEVVTLWYRPPEILMGVRGYSSAVDIWSVGCIFAEMAQGKPLFTGISEIDQLFQIFSKLSTPTSDTWPGFSSLPNYHFEFPHWKRRPLNRLFPGISDLGIDLLTKLLVYNPDQRITAEDALRHPYFSSEAPAFLPLTPKIPMDQMCYTMKLESWKEIKYLSRQKTLRPAHRSMLVDWLIEVVDVFEMCLRTAFLAVNYTDRYLDIVMVKKTQFQLLGATCLHVASKCEDVSYIGVEDLAMCADNVYTSVEVLEMEEKLLNTLNFTLSVPTALDFLNIYERMIPPIQKKTSMLAHYLLELALQEYQFLKYLPSVVAACCLSMAMYTMDGFPMTKELVDACQYNWSDLKECMGELQTLYSNSPSNNLAVIKKRYSKAERCQVANVLPPTSFSMAF